MSGRETMTLFPTPGESDKATATGAMMVGGGKRQRQKDDFYPTTAEAAIAFMEAEAAYIRSAHGKLIAEPACGDGALVTVFESYGFEVVKSDLVDRGCGARVLDFLTMETAPARAVITNPPYKGDMAGKFVRQAKRLGVEYLALLLPCRYWNTGGHLRLWNVWPPAMRYPLTWKIDCLGLGNPVMEFDWIVWHAGRVDLPGWRPLPKPSLERVADLFGGQS